MPRVSVIVPIYNAEPYLRECVDSILSQTYTDVEVILVDDGSTDGSGTVIDGYAAADSRVRAVHKENGGPSSARNAGLEAASCPYVYFPDSDDILDPALLEKAVPGMEAGNEMVVFGFDMLPPPEKKDRIPMAYPVREEKELLLDTGEKKLAFLEGPFRRRAIRWELWNRIFRRDIIEKWNIRFGEGRRVFAEDMYFTYFYMAHISRILLIPDKLYTYRRHEGSGSTEYKKHLMIWSSNFMTESFYEHCRTSEDCRYLYGHFLPLYYLLHKGAVRRLRRHQWKNGLSMERAREILKENVVDWPVFRQRMRDMYGAPAVRDSYRKDRGLLLQFTDRLYTGELLEMPGPKIVTAARRAALSILRRAENRRQTSE